MRVRVAAGLTIAYSDAILMSLPIMAGPSKLTDGGAVLPGGATRALGARDVISTGAPLPGWAVVEAVA